MQTTSGSRTKDRGGMGGGVGTRTKDRSGGRWESRTKDRCGGGRGRAGMVAMVGKDAAQAPGKWGTGVLGGSRSRARTCRALVGVGAWGARGRLEGTVEHQHQEPPVSRVAGLLRGRSTETQRL